MGICTVLKDVPVVRKRIVLRIVEKMENGCPGGLNGSPQTLYLVTLAITQYLFCTTLYLIDCIYIHSYIYILFITKNRFPVGEVLYAKIFK